MAWNFLCRETSKAIKNLRNDSFESYLTLLISTKEIEYSLWKGSKNILWAFDKVLH